MTLGIEPDRIAGALAQAMMRLGKNQQLIDEIAPGERPDPIELDVRLAIRTGVNTGGVVSLTRIVCVHLATFPQALVAAQQRLIRLLHDDP